MLSIALLFINQLVLIAFIVRQYQENKRLQDQIIKGLEEHYIHELNQIRADIEKYIIED